MQLSEFSKCGLTIIRDGEFELLAKISDSFSNEALCFLDDYKYLEQINNNNLITAVICREQLSQCVSLGKGVAISNAPKASFIGINNTLRSELHKTTIGKHCKISGTAQISEFGVRIGDNVTIGDFVVVHDNVSIGDGCCILNNSIIGAECYERCRDLQGGVVIARHNGGVTIGNHTVVDRGL